MMSRQIFVEKFDEIMKRYGRRFDPDPSGLRNDLPDDLTVVVRNRPVVVPNTPVCTMDDLLALLYLIDHMFASEMDRKWLPEGHAWQEKGLQGVQAAADALDIYHDVFAEMPEENVFLLALLAAAHDLGRARGFARHGDPQYSGRHHGHFSVEVLQEGGLEELGFSLRTLEVITYVLIHHADKDTPSLPDRPSDTQALAFYFTAIIRDVDKVSLFRNKTSDYLFNTKVKKQQNEVLRQLNPNFKGETGQIEAGHYLDEFLAGRTLDRKDLLSYEAYMLQFLAWIYDLNLPESLAAVVESNAVHLILSYLQGRLRTIQFLPIKEATIAYLHRNNVPFRN